VGANKEQKNENIKIKAALLANGRFWKTNGWCV
jgi:hypothetical protein